MTDAPVTRADREAARRAIGQWDDGAIAQAIATARAEGREEVIEAVGRMFDRAGDVSVGQIIGTWDYVRARLEAK